MLSKTTIRYIKSLRHRKFRQKYHKIAVEGEKSVQDVLSGKKVGVSELYATDTWIEASGSLLHNAGISAISISEREMAAISAFTTPQRVLAVCEMPAWEITPEEPLTQLCLYLDGVRDPGNAGTIFRIADWFGIDKLYLSPDTVDPYNPKVIQASMGSLFRVSWAEESLERLLKVPGIAVYASDTHGTSIYEHALSRTGLIVLGNEGSGIRLDAGSVGIQHIAIPDSRTLGAESLNVAVAAGIICSEFRRRFT